MHSIDFIKLSLLIIAVKKSIMKTNINGAKGYYNVANLLLPSSLLTIMLEWLVHNVMMETIHEGKDLSVYGRHLYPLFYITSLMAKVFTLFIKRSQLNNLLLVQTRVCWELKSNETLTNWKNTVSLARTCAFIAVCQF